MKDGSEKMSATYQAEDCIGMGCSNLMLINKNHSRLLENIRDRATNQYDSCGHTFFKLMDTRECH